MADKRKRLLNLICSPSIRTLEQVQALRLEVRKWMENHPDDVEMLETSETLVMLERGMLTA